MSNFSYRTAFWIGVPLTVLAVCIGIYYEIRLTGHLPGITQDYGKGIDGLVSSGEYEQALPQLQMALLLDDANDPEVLRLLGDSYSALGNSEEAVRHYEQALGYEPESALLHYRLALALEADGDSQQALEHLYRSAELAPDNADTQARLGILLHKQRQLSAAAAAYRRALQLNESLPQAANNLAWLLATSQDESIRNPTEALRWATVRAEASDFSEPSALDTLAAAYAANLQFDEAVHWEQKAIELASSDAKATMQKRLALYQAGSPYRQP